MGQLRRYTMEPLSRSAMGLRHGAALIGGAWSPIGFGIGAALGRRENWLGSVSALVGA
jgi:hypothetical protein